jgi:hypothetical protein
MELMTGFHVPGICVMPTTSSSFARAALDTAQRARAHVSKAATEDARFTNRGRRSCI